jgi:6-phosphogluconolactonase
MIPAEPLSKFTAGNAEVLVFRDIEEMSHHAACEWIALSERAISRRGRFTAALSGGRSPVPLYRRLAGIGKSGYWDRRVHIFLVDERFVPFEADESNYGLIREKLLNHLRIPDGNVHPIATDTGTPEIAARKYERDLTYFFNLEPGALPVFDLVLLGMGEDGHTASLFPGTPAVSESLRLAVTVTPADAVKKERVSITFPVINNADNIIFMVSGSAKSEALRDVLEKHDVRLPATQVSASRGRLYFLVDEGAARLLTQHRNA